MRLTRILIFFGSFALDTWISSLVETPLVSQEDVGLSMTEFCRKYGYILYNETAKSSDNYMLTLHRISCAKHERICTGDRRPILIMHGLLGSSVDFVTARHQSLAFQLADKGFDVWLGNSRGNTYSRKHVELDPNRDSSFWNFSFHEIGVIDIPTMVDHIIARTNFSKITYIGMSQGSTAYFIMTSSRPEYNSKILLANVIAPVTTLFNTRSPVFRALAILNPVLELIYNSTGPIETFGDNSLLTSVLRTLCLSRHKILKYLCTEVVIKYLIGSSELINYDILTFHMSLSPCGASNKQWMHYVQNKISGTFCQYDYYLENHARYGQSKPPVYNLSKITAPLAVYFGKADIFINKTHFFKDIEAIPNKALLYEVPHDQFNHLDFIYSKNLNYLLNKKLIQTIETFNKNIKPLFRFSVLLRKTL